jgi:hypothetical protein
MLYLGIEAMRPKVRRAATAKSLRIGRKTTGIENHETDVSPSKKNPTKNMHRKEPPRRRGAMRRCIFKGRKKHRRRGL